MEKLKFHTAILWKIKDPVLHGTVKNKSLPVYIIHRTVQIRRPQNIGSRNPFEKFLLCLDLVSSIVSPVPIRSYLHRFLKGLRQMLRIHCARADENIISKLSQTIKQIRDILPVISVDVQNHIKKIILEYLPQMMPIRLDQICSLRLWMVIPV